MSISIIIPTIGRKLDLLKVLESIEANSVKPHEVLIIDQGGLDQDIFKKFNLNLTLIKINKKSLTQAENIGAELAKGEIISILDDDVVLDKDYLKSVLKSFEKHKKVKIVQGKIMNDRRHWLINFFWWIFLGPGSFTQNNFVRLYNLENFHNSHLNKEIFCMWASGCNMNIKKDVFDYEKFDSQLLRAAYGGEDVDFSFRVYKRFGINSILFQPRAKLIHNVASSMRLPKYSHMLMRRIHMLYLCHKNIEHLTGVKHAIKHVWYIFGCALLSMLRIFKGDYKSIFYFFAIEYQVLLHKRDIKNLDIEWMNLKLFNEKSIPRARIIKKYVL